MSTWQLFSDSGNNFRWESPSQQLPTPKPYHQNHSDSPPSRFPSFEDVLLQGQSMILEDCETPDVDKIPVFRNGLGNSVVLKSSSIAKASSVLGVDYSLIDTGQSCITQSGFTSPNSMFQTGSGKKVSVSSAGLLRAKALLGLNESNDEFDIQGFKPAIKKFSGNDSYAPEKRFKEVVLNGVGNETSSVLTKVPPLFKTNLTGNEFVGENIGKILEPKSCSSSSKPPPIKFHTAGGRSISVSSDALQRARSLLGDPEMGNFLDEGDAGASMSSFFNKDTLDVKSFNSDGNFFKSVKHTNSSLTHHQQEMSEQNPKVFVSPMRSSVNREHSEAKSDIMLSGTNLLSKFDAEERISKTTTDTSCLKKPFHEPDTLTQFSGLNGLCSSIHRPKRSLGGPLADITNITGIDLASKKGATTELRRLGKRSSVSPFKRPRNAKFITPLNSNLSCAPDGFVNRVSEASHSRKRVSTHYPFQNLRPYTKDFFKVPPKHPKELKHLPDQVQLISPVNSGKYMFSDGSQFVGVEAFHDMLAQSGASMQHATKQWVANHYKWIVWKLASYERCYSAKFTKKFLTISNVLDELKYRYEREINHGQRSSIKKILEGDAAPSSMLVLCVSAIRSASEIGTPSTSGVEMSSSASARLELTDGWYSIDAQLDVILSKHLAAGKVFVGQKLQICGAGLNGWDGRVSPLEVSPSISLLLHINGTYRAGWAERLGFCKGACPPLAFRCVKSNGGPIPRTLVGITRIYPVLYRERLRSGDYIVRSEKTEAAFSQLYNQRRSDIIEGVASDFQRGSSSSCNPNDYDNEEGARILKMLESAAEPELLMAEMSSEQLSSFSMYRAKVEASRQFDLQRLIEKELEEAGLSAREVTPFMRVRVVGLKSDGPAEAKDPREGLITIWNPTERQQLELSEGQAYAISGLIPLHSDLNLLYLQARGSNSKWQPLSTKEQESFVPFFKPRKPVSLSRIGEIPLSSEFDTAVLILHVGLEYIVGQQKKQWVFVADGSLCKLQPEESTKSLLAISFSSLRTEDDSISPINHNLIGSIVGFCNLVKRTKDHMNNMWVAEATENTTYYLNNDYCGCSHLKDAFAFVKKWQQSSNLIIEKLKEKVLHIVGGCKG